MGTNVRRTGGRPNTSPKLRAEDRAAPQAAAAKAKPPPSIVLGRMSAAAGVRKEDVAQLDKMRSPRPNQDLYRQIDGFVRTAPGLRDLGAFEQMRLVSRLLDAGAGPSAKLIEQAFLGQRDAFE